MSFRLLSLVLLLQPFSASADGLWACLLETFRAPASQSLKPAAPPVSAPAPLGRQEKIWALEREGRAGEAESARQELEQLLASTPTTGARYAGSGIHQAKRASLLGVSGVEVILKTENAKSEVAAYRLDRILGQNRVPLTVLRSDDRTVSAQVFVASERSARPNEMGSTLYDADLRAFDFLIQNTDRNNTNILIRSDGTIVAIDHEAAVFRSVYSLESFFPWEDLRPTDTLLESLSKLDIEILRAGLGDLLPEPQLQLILKRRDQLLDRFR